MAAQLAQVTARLDAADLHKRPPYTVVDDHDETAIHRWNTWDPESFFSGE